MIDVLADLRVLHLFANFKWTGPADPAMRTAVHLRKLGLDVVFARAAWTLPDAEHRMEKELAKAQLPVIGGLELPKHFKAIALLRDRRQLARRLRRGDFGLLHAHQPTDHLVAALAKGRAAKSGKRVVLVRTLYDAQAPKSSWRTRIAFGATDGVVVPSDAVAAEVRERFKLPEARVLVQEPATEIDRNQVAGDLRPAWGLGAEHVLVGITARIQPHRRFELLWEAAALVVRQNPAVRFVLLGRGNAEDTEQLVREPIARLDLTGHVLLPGYLYEPDYTRALRSLDLFLFLVPGSDGTCRAVREAMAMGQPVLVTPRGMLPQIVKPEPSAPSDAPPPGLVVEESASAMAAAILDLAARADVRRAMGRSARRKVEQAMHPVTAARRLAEFYLGLLSRAASGSP